MMVMATSRPKDPSIPLRWKVEGIKPGVEVTDHLVDVGILGHRYDLKRCETPRPDRPPGEREPADVRARGVRIARDQPPADGLLTTFDDVAYA
jgi:hypothetical protein